MSRHRIVRRMNYDDERFDDDEYDYGHSYEDSYCVSPSTAAQFTYNRDKDFSLSSFVEEEIPEETEADMDLETEPSESNTAEVSGDAKLTDVDRARLHSCLEEMVNIMGDTVPEADMTAAVLHHHFNIEAALNSLLSNSKDGPKPQRTPRKKKDRTQGTTNTATAPSQPPPSQTALLSSPLPTPVVTAAVTPKQDARKGFQVDAKNKTSTPQQTPSEAATERLTGDIRTLSLATEGGGAKAEGGGAKAKNSAVSLVSGSSQRSESPSSSRSQTPQRSEMPHAPMGVPRSSSKSKNDKIDAKAEYAKRQGDKEMINLVVIGHVDAGKSTLMGHVLYQLGSVHQRTMHKYEQESRKLGKSSFAYAWVLDETEEERSRGVTMDVAQTRFVTEKKMVTLLDAPGHKDFIPNMITGAAQADVAILVINAARGEFETGFDSGGQTREHALLARSLGVSQMIVAVNKMDSVEWDAGRYGEIERKLRQFLRQVGFKEADLSFVPCSGLGGENLTTPATEPRLTAWYSGPTIVSQIDKFRSPERPVDKPFRLHISDVFKGATGGFSIAGRVNAGYIRPGDKVMVMPAGNLAGVKNLSVDDLSAQVAFAGDQVTFMLTGIDMSSVVIGFVLCDPQSPPRCATRIRARIVLFNLEVPITRGIPVVFHYQSINEPAVIKRLVASLNKSTGEVVKNRPKCLTKNSSAVVELEFERSVCVELYAQYRDLGRFMLRNGGHTIAAGMIEEILQEKVQKDD